LQSVLGTSDYQINKEEGVVTFLEKSGKYRITYAKPLIRVASSPYASYTPLEWDNLAREIVVTLPACEAPVILVFGLHTRVPTADTPSPFPSILTRLVKPLKDLIDAIGTNKGKKLEV
jgi:hypothetical protein